MDSHTTRRRASITSIKSKSLQSNSQWQNAHTGLAHRTSANMQQLTAQLAITTKHSCRIKDSNYSQLMYLKWVAPASLYPQFNAYTNVTTQVRTTLTPPRWMLRQQRTHHNELKFIAISKKNQRLTDYTFKHTKHNVGNWTYKHSVQKITAIFRHISTNATQWPLIQQLQEQ